MFMVCFIPNCCPCEKKEEKLDHVLPPKNTVPHPFLGLGLFVGDSLREEDEGKTDILVCPIKRMVIDSLQKLTEWYFSKRNDSFNGILCNIDLLMVFFRNDDLSML